MRHVDLTVTAPAADPETAFNSLSDYESYPSLTESVRRVERRVDAAGQEICTWEVLFRRGVLIWTEHTDFDVERRCIDFSLIDGDLDSMSGAWRVSPRERGGCEIHFSCEFDMGIPTLAHLIEPVAADTLRDNVVSMCEGLFGEVTSVDNLADATT